MFGLLGLQEIPLLRNSSRIAGLLIGLWMSVAHGQTIGPPPPIGGSACTGDFCGATAPLSASLGGTGISSLGIGIPTFLGTPSSANLAGALTDETGTGSAVFATNPVLVTPNLGTPSAVALTNATGLPITTGVSGLGTGCATWLATPSSSNLAVCLTDETGTGAAVFGNNPTFAGNGAASIAAALFNGTIFTGGNGTTTFPFIFIQPAGTTAVTTWSTNGTGLGMNLASGCTGNFLDFRVSGGASLFNVSCAGSATVSGNLTLGATSFGGWTGRSLVMSPANGTVEFLNNSSNGFTRLQFGGTTSSFGALQTNGTETDSELADGSARAPFGMSNLFASGFGLIGASSGATESVGELAFAKETASGTAPAAGFFKLEAVAGTVGGTCKLIAYAGTSTTAVTVVDNVGTGC